MNPAGSSMTARHLGVTAGLGLLLVAAPLRAGSFRDDGTYAFDPSAIDIFDFEDGSAAQQRFEKRLRRLTRGIR